ncbi:unnamed protein product [Blepharisma stoltei]|uniref:Uncharacterized protein n=1 Tax=Blepharisma stoltei TaxID=1481888 RepID=A0AAU9JCB7_9CILI|nr:unnamed protein product [Blepharisma stoltei]
MCKLNLNCQVQDSTCTCASQIHSKGFRPCQNYLDTYGILPKPIFPEEQSQSPIFQLIAQQMKAIKILTERSAQTTEKLIQLTQIVDRLANNQQTPEAVSPCLHSSESVTTSEDLLTAICGPHQDFDFFIQLVNEIPNPAYKERAFQVVAQIVDAEGNKVTLPNMVSFNIMLFTTESPTKSLKVNTSGDKIMRGTTEVEATSELVFRKVVIKEVTSHFRNGCIFMAICPKQNSRIKPLIINNVVVKARKLCPNAGAVKKLKTEEDNI